MKKIIYISLISLLCLPMYSCLDASSLMDKEDVGDLYEDDVFTSGTYARYFVNDIYYNIISKGYGIIGGSYLDCATDNGEARPLGGGTHLFNTGNWNAANNPLGFIWTNSYAEIRAARPDQAAARQAMTDLLEACKLKNCVVQEGYINSLGMK